MRTRSVLGLGLVGVLGFTGVAQACSMCSPDPWEVCTPGFGAMGVYVGMVLVVLAGFLERPFASGAGVPQNAAALSLQGNLLSAIPVGMVGVMAEPYFLSSQLNLLGWVAVALAARVLIEVWWLSRQSGGIPIRWGWIVVGNVFSSTVIFLLPLLQVTVLPNSVQYAYWRPLDRNRDIIAILTMVVCALVFVAAFWRTGIRPRQSPSRGFEVLPAAMPVRPRPPLPPQHAT